jgi:hypothetical protein
MEHRNLLFALAASALLASPSSAYTPEELDAAAAIARAVEADVLWLADDALEGRGSGSAGGAAAEELLIDELEQIGAGLDSNATGRDAYRQDFDDVRTNLLALIPGGSLANEYVVVGGHWDHFAPGNCRDADENDEDDICNGANDNASGTAVVLAIGRAIASLPEPPDRSVVIALWDGEEIGLLGSKHFVANPLVPLEDVAAYVNFDLLGATLLPSLRDVSFVIGAESGGELLSTLTSEAIDTVGLGIRPLSVTFGQGRSDYHPFWGEGVPVAFFGDSTNACYHTVDDEIPIVHFDKLARQSETGFRLVTALAESEERPAFVPLQALDTYEDLVSISELLTIALGDVDVVEPDYVDDLVDAEAQARAGVEAGPEAFSPSDALLLAQDALEISTNGVPCDAALLPEPGDGVAGALVLFAAAVATRCQSRGRSPSGSHAAPRWPKSKRSGARISA